MEIINPEVSRLVADAIEANSVADATGYSGEDLATLTREATPKAFSWSDEDHEYPGDSPGFHGEVNCEPDFLIEPEARGENPYLPAEYRKRLIDAYPDLFSGMDHTEKPIELEARGENPYFSVDYPQRLQKLLAARNTNVVPGADEAKSWDCVGQLTTAPDVVIDYEQAKSAIKNYFGGREIGGEPTQFEELPAIEPTPEDVNGRTSRVLAIADSTLARSAETVARAVSNVELMAERAGISVEEVLGRLEATLSEPQLQQAAKSWMPLNQYNAIRKVVKDSKRGSHTCACGATISRNKTVCRPCNEKQINPPATAGASFSAST